MIRFDAILLRNHSTFQKNKTKKKHYSFKTNTEVEL